MAKITFTSESVCAGHPDKICDQISDAILDAALSKDKYSRVAVEALVTENYVSLAGELTTSGRLSYKGITRKVIRDLGYTNPEFKFTDKSPIAVKIHTQSPDIAAGVDKKGAGDQGMMYGFACSETEEFMPLPITLAHQLVKRVDEVREKKILKYLRPDGKSQVTVAYNSRKPVAVEKVVLAVPHSPDVSLEQVKDEVYKKVVLHVMRKYGYDVLLSDLIINGTGVWHFPGPGADTGVTGRKIVVDTYGGVGHVGGGCFSGKDPTKVDRSSAYAARFLAKNIVASGLADRCEVRLAYFIGAVKPVMQQVETFGTAKKSRTVICDYMDKLLDTSVEGIIDRFRLRRPIYLKTAAYGHFGRSEFPWEEIVD